MGKSVEKIDLTQCRVQFLSSFSHDFHGPLNIFGARRSPYWNAKSVGSNEIKISKCTTLLQMLYTNTIEFISFHEYMNVL